MMNSRALSVGHILRKRRLLPRQLASTTDAKRPPSSWKKRVYAQLCKQDGARCFSCHKAEEWRWAAMGTVSASSDWRDYFQSLQAWVGQTHVQYIGWRTNLHVDHKTPLWAGGGNDLNNLWLLCEGCHKVKTGQEASMRNWWA